MSVQARLGEVAAGLATTRALKRCYADALLKRIFSGVKSLRKARELFADQLAPDFRLFDYLRLVAKKETILEFSFPKSRTNGLFLASRPIGSEIFILE